MNGMPEPLSRYEAEGPFMRLVSLFPACYVRSKHSGALRVRAWGAWAFTAHVNRHALMPWVALNEAHVRGTRMGFFDFREALAYAFCIAAYPDSEETWVEMRKLVDLHLDALRPGMREVLLRSSKGV